LEATDDAGFEDMRSMNENRVEGHDGDRRLEEIDGQDEERKHADAIEFLLTQVPSMAEQLPASTRWIECGEREPDPHGIF
jgi:hypothetical protein